MDSFLPGRPFSFVAELYAQGLIEVGAIGAIWFGQQAHERPGPRQSCSHVFLAERQAFNAGLVDECHLFIWPVVLGGRKPALPTDTRAELELLDERRFSNGVVQLRYRPL